MQGESNLLVSWCNCLFTTLHSAGFPIGSMTNAVYLMTYLWFL
jgi:hypothetical protein